MAVEIDPKSFPITDEANTRFVAALRATRTGTWTWDVRSDRVECDGTLADIYGIPYAEAPTNAAGFLKLVHPDECALASRVITGSLERDIDPNYEFRTILRDGSIRWIYDQSKLVRDDAGQPIYMIGACS